MTKWKEEIEGLGKAIEGPNFQIVSTSSEMGRNHIQNHHTPMPSLLLDMKVSRTRKPQSTSSSFWGL